MPTARWPAGFKEDETLWHPATAGEAYLLRRLWDAAAQQYGDALKSRYINAHARMAMYKQVERIRMCFAILGVEIPPPLGDPKTFFSVGPSTGEGTGSTSPAPPGTATGQLGENP